MREIKFKGKTANGQWFYGSLVYSDNIEPAIYFEVGKGSIKTFDFVYVKPETVGQFTGLYAGVFNDLCGDKEYDKIYEGDKISVTYATQGMSNSHEHTITGVVAFKDGSFVVEWDFPKKGKYKYQTLNSIKRLGDCGVVIKIIGNIHNNAELLEAESGSCY